MADETQTPNSKRWCDEKTYFAAFWIGVATCALVQILFVVFGSFFGLERIYVHEKHFVLKCVRNACTAMPIAGVVAVLFVLMTRWRWWVSWILVLPTAQFIIAILQQFYDRMLEWNHAVLLFVGLVAMVAIGGALLLLRKRCDYGHDGGILYIVLMTLLCEGVLLQRFLGTYGELRHMLSFAAVYSIFVIDGLIALFVRKLQNRGIVSRGQPRFRFSLRSLMILILTAGAWASLIVTLHRKPHEKPVPIQRV